MSRVVYLVVFVFLVLFTSQVHASTPALSVVTQEFVSQVISYDQVIEVDGQIIEAPGEPGENRSGISRTGVELYDTQITGFLNISNIEHIGNHTLSSINITMNGTDTIESWFVIPPTPGYLSFYSSVDMLNPGGAPEVYFFIPELRVGDSLILGFNVSPGSYGEPLNFTEIYSDWRILTGRSINITLNVTNNFRDNLRIYDLLIYKTPHLYPSDNGGFTSFFYSDLRGEDSANANIFIDGIGRTVLNWTPLGGSLERDETTQIIFNSTAPQNISVNWAGEDDWAMWMNMGNLSAEFKIDGSLSGITIKNVTAVSTAAMAAVTKERINVSGFWNASINLTNVAKSPLDFELRQISIWATQMGEFSDPGNIETWVNRSTTFATLYGEMPNSYANATWFPRLNWSAGSTIDNFSIVFNYSYVPIVWMVADFVIFDDGNQIFKLNQSLSRREDDYLLIEEIYVLLGGYLMKATKSITPLVSSTGHRYQVNITLENIGTENTPELVTMFDMLPKDFNPIIFSTESSLASRAMTTSQQIMRVSDRSGDINKRVTGPDISDFVLGSQDTGEIISGPYQGYWGYNIDFSSVSAGSDGDGLYDPSLSESEILIRYKMQGNTSLARIENAYIVGIDPIRLEGASPSQSVASRLSIMSSSLELIILISALIFSISMLTATLIIVKTGIEVKK